MTREEAIDELSVIYERLSHTEDCANGVYSFADGDYLEAIEMGIEALSADAVQEAVPTVVRVTMSDGSQYYLEHDGERREP